MIIFKKSAYILRVFGAKSLMEINNHKITKNFYFKYIPII